MLPVNEVFQTIQGEAAFTGSPAVFVRLQGCPVGCAWCDTKHTWVVDGRNRISMVDMERKAVDDPTFAQMSVAELVALCARFEARHIVITGGEPCLYDLCELTGALLETGRTVQIETSGTHEILCHPDTWVTVSPKVDMPGGLAVRRDALERADEIKHPVGKPADIENLETLLDDVGEHLMVWLQPLSQSPKATELCVREATARNWRVSVQVHKYIGVR